MKKLLSGTTGFVCVILLLSGFALAGCARGESETARIQLEEGLELPALISLAWLVDEDSQGGERFVSVTEDGLCRVWDVFSG